MEKLAWKGINTLKKEKKTVSDPIITWMRKTKFKKKLFGGVDEDDVWKKIRELHDIYKAAILAERLRYDALLKEFRSEIDSEQSDEDESAREEF